MAILNRTRVLREERAGTKAVDVDPRLSLFFLCSAERETIKISAETTAITLIIYFIICFVYTRNNWIERTMNISSFINAISKMDSPLSTLRVGFILLV